MTYDKKLNDCPSEYNKRHDFHEVPFHQPKANIDDVAVSLFVCLYCGQMRTTTRRGRIVVTEPPKET